MLVCNGVVQSKHFLIAALGVVLLAGVAWIAMGGGDDPAPIPNGVGGVGTPAAPQLEPSQAITGDDREAVPTGEESVDPVELEPVEAPDDRVPVSIRGRVIDAFDRPIASASVQLQIGRSMRGRRGFAGRGGFDEAVETGPDGVFAFEGEGYAGAWVSLLITHAAQAPHFADHSFEAEQTELDVGDVRVPAGGVVIGTITDGGGIGIPGAVAELIPQRENRLRWLRDRDELLPPVTTDGNGFFRMSHVALGDYRVEASAPQYQRETSTPITITEGTETHLDPIRLGPAQQLRGIVLSPRGTPVPDAEVWLFTERGEDGETTTDAEGRFSLDHLRSGAASIRVRADGFVTYHEDNLDPSTAQELTIQLQQGLRVSGVVRDELSGRPVLRYAARIRRLGDLPENSEDVRGDVAEIREAIRRRGGDGRVLRRVEEIRQRWSGARSGRGPRGWDGEVVDRDEGAFSFAGMDEGVYEIDVDSPDHQLLTSEPVELRVGGAPPHLVLSAARGLTVRGLVVAAKDGEPLANARVDLLRIEEQQAEPAGEDPRSRVRRMFRQGGGWPVLDAQTDRAGRFELRNAPPGRYAVRASASGYAEKRSSEFELSRDLDALELELGATCRLEGAVLGVPAGRESEVRVIAFAGPRQMQDTTARADGTYVIEDLQPGSYIVRASLGDSSSVFRREMRQFFGGGEGQQPEFDVVLAEGATRTFNPVLSVQAVGEVVGSIMLNGRPGQGLRVSLQAADPAQSAADDGRRFRFAFHGGGSIRARTNQNGEFSLSEVQEGDYSLVVQAADNRNELYRGPITVVRSSRNEQRLSLQTVTFAGEVAGADALPEDLRGSLRLYAGVDSEPEDRRAFAEDNRYYSIRVREGRFEQADLAPGDYLMVLRISGFEVVEQPLSLYPGMAAARFTVAAKNQ